MMCRDPVKTFYYTDERNQEFSGIKRSAKVIDENYPFIHKNPLWRAASFVVLRLFVTPFAYLFCKAKHGMRIHNKQVLRPYRGKGLFLFGNHTQVPGDGFMQALVAFPMRSYAVVNADNVALRGTENLMQMIGALPLPTTLKGYRPFIEAMRFRLKQGSAVSIYPEAHIWPYYTGIRDFPATAFQYPVKEGAPSFSFTVTYHARKHRKTPRIDVYIDGPFLPDEALKPKDAAQKLRDEVHRAMKARAACSDMEYYRYLPKDEEGGEG